MPDSYGHAKQFFDDSIPDGNLNPKRNLLQFHNGSPTKPQADDIIVLGWSKYGHVAIISKVTDNDIEIVQQKGEDFASFIWSFVNDQPIINHYKHLSEVPTQTEISRAMSKALKKRDFSFVGPTTCYAFMQSMGLVNDHLTNCFCAQH